VSLLQFFFYLLLFLRRPSKSFDFPQRAVVVFLMGYLVCPVDEDPPPRLALHSFPLPLSPFPFCPPWRYGLWPNRRLTCASLYEVKGPPS